MSGRISTSNYTANYSLPNGRRLLFSVTSNRGVVVAVLDAKGWITKGKKTGEPLSIVYLPDREYQEGICPRREN